MPTRYRFRPRARSPTPLPFLRMTPTKKPKPDRAPSAALPPLTEQDLDSLAQITPADIASAQRAFRKQAPADNKALLDATDADTEG